ncbi:unnamed protein product [Coccothraustes coccothraustes]
MLALAQAFPLYQEGPCPVATMPRHPRLAPAVCGTWSRATSTQGGRCRKKRAGIPLEREDGTFLDGTYSCGCGGPYSTVDEADVAKHASKVSLGNRLTVLFFCEFIKECSLLLLAQKM